MEKKVRISLLKISVLTLSACTPVDSNTLKFPDVQHHEIQIFFAPGPDCENNIIKRINKADKIDIAVYSITNPNITNAIITAHKRGADIRVITDKTQAKGKKSLVGKIKQSGIPVRMNRRHKIEHNKFAVFDGVVVVSGSYNWTTSASMYNSENCLFFDQPNSEYSNQFEYLWNMYKNEVAQQPLL